MRDLPTEIPAELFAAWFELVSVRGIYPIAGGLSGSLVWRVRLADDTQWALRRWPTGTTRARIEEVHRVVQAARSEHFPLAPSVRRVGDGRSWQACDGFVWDCHQWIDGEAFAGELVDGSANWQRVCPQGAVASARFSAAVASSQQLGGLAAGGSPGASKTVAARVTKVSELDDCFRAYGARLLEAAQRHAWSRQDERLVTATSSWLYCWPACIGQLKQWLSRVSEQQWPLVWILGDHHVGNLLFRHGELVGIVDYDAVRYDSPACDLARLFGSYQLVSGVVSDSVLTGSIWEPMVAAYRAIRPLKGQEEELAGGLVRWSPVITLGNWIQWVLVEERSFAGSTEEILERIQGWQRIVVNLADNSI